MAFIIINNRKHIMMCFSTWRTSTLTVDQLKAFLAELQQNKELLRSIEKTATANEVVQVANEFGFKFSGDELKAISKENIPGVKVKKQDTSPSYSFGESGN